MITLLMKPVLFLMAFLFVAQTTFGQSFDQNKMFYAAKAEKYRKMKTTGMLLTLVGAGLTVAGISKISNSTSSGYYSNGNYYSNSNNSAETGVLMYLGGVAGLGAGIPLWIVGGHAQRKYERKLQGIGVRLNINQQNKGLVLSYRF